MTLVKLFGFVPDWLWAAVVAGLLTTQIITGTRLSAERLAHQTTQTEYAERLAAAERARADEEATRRRAEQELHHAQDQHAAQVADLQSELARSRTAASASAGRLRDAAAAAAERARAQCANPAVAELGAAADDPIGVLADVLRRADQRAGELADIAEQRGIAGRACEREYDAIRQALNKD